MIWRPDAGRWIAARITRAVRSQEVGEKLGLGYPANGEERQLRASPSSRGPRKRWSFFVSMLIERSGFPTLS